MEAHMNIEVAPSEVADRITILELKVRHAHGATASAVATQLEALRQAWRSALLPDLATLQELHMLRSVNGALWDVEDALRNHEESGRFGPVFVARARSVYRLNDRRNAIKRALDARLGSKLTEHKLFTAQTPSDAILQIG
jgi:hypothetical protein